MVNDRKLNFYSLNDQKDTWKHWKQGATITQRASIEANRDFPQ